jgi:ribose 5-phosphate isomerase A
MSEQLDHEMQRAAEHAATLIPDGAVVGLGTGVTVGHLLPLLVSQRRGHTFVATSPRTERAAAELGIQVRPFTDQEQLDVAIDGADQIAPDGWLIKGGGGAHTREKIVAAASRRFIVIAASNKEVSSLHPPVPVEVLAFGHAATLRQLDPVRLREAPRTPDGGLLADYLGLLDEPRATAEWLAATPGVIGHGLFSPELVDDIIVGHGDDVVHRSVSSRPGTAPS